MFCIQLVGLCLINSKDFGVFSTIFREDSLYGVEWFRQFDKKVKNRCREIFLILLYDGSIPVCMYLQLDVIFLSRTQVECIGLCVFDCIECIDCDRYSIVIWYWICVVPLYKKLHWSFETFKASIDSFKSKSNTP